MDSIQSIELPNKKPRYTLYDCESFVDKGETPEDPLTWNHKEGLVLLGTAYTINQAPYEDKDTEIWAVAQCVTYDAFKRADLLFEIHQDSYWRQPNVLKRLQQTALPIYMIDQYEEIPTSVRFPIELILPYRRYHKTSITYMLAFAYHLFLTTGNPKTIGLFGIHMEGPEEYATQRPCCEYWLGRMEAAGMGVLLPDAGAVLKAENLYAYEGYSPAIPLIKDRLSGLQAGLVKRRDDVYRAKDDYSRQEGAIKECAHWLNVFQRGIDG